MEGCQARGGYLAAAASHPFVRLLAAHNLLGWLNLQQLPGQATPALGWFWALPDGTRVAHTVRANAGMEDPGPWGTIYPDDDDLNAAEMSRANYAVLVDHSDKLQDLSKNGSGLLRPALCMWHADPVHCNTRPPIAFPSLPFTSEDTSATGPSPNSLAFPGAVDNASACFGEASSLVVGEWCFGMTSEEVNRGSADVLCEDRGGWLAVLPSHELVREAAARDLEGHLNLLQRVNQGQPDEGWFWLLPDGTRINHTVHSSIWNTPDDDGSGEENYENYVFLEKYSGKLQEDTFTSFLHYPAICMYTNRTLITTTTTSTTSTTTTTTTTTTAPILASGTNLGQKFHLFCFSRLFSVGMKHFKRAATNQTITIPSGMVWCREQCV